MSCWVVPAVAAEYWGITLDVVQDRIKKGLIPQKVEDGFVFVDVAPWTPSLDGLLQHQLPPTFTSEPEPEDLEIAGAELDAFDDFEEAETSSPFAWLLAEAAADDESEDGESQTPGEEDLSPDDELPDLDEEESATFGRLSWQDVRQQVGRTRRPPSPACS